MYLGNHVAGRERNDEKKITTKKKQPKSPELFTQQRQNTWQDILDILSGDI